MGKNDNLIEDYRNVITNTILENELVLKVLDNDYDDDSDAPYDMEKGEELLWKHLIPQQFIPDTISETGSYIMYDLSERTVTYGNNYKNTYTEVTLYFWVITHKDMPKFKQRLRNDILVRELKNMFEDEGGLGIAKNHLLDNNLFNVGNYNYTGRIMRFLITDWSDRIRKNKHE